MLPVELLSALKAYAQNQENGAAGINSPGLPALESTLQPGQQITGLVLAQVAEGVFNVRIGGQLLQLPLPAIVQTGETVQLQVVSLQPRLTFGLMPGLPTASAAGVTVPQLSVTARLLASLQQTQTPADKAVISPTSTAPLLVPEGAPDATVLAKALEQSLSTSGLFYEAHQAQWVGGGRSIAQLLQEPQNQPPTSAPSPAPSSPTAGAGQPAAPAEVAGISSSLTYSNAAGTVVVSALSNPNAATANNSNVGAPNPLAPGWPGASGAAPGAAGVQAGSAQVAGTAVPTLPLHVQPLVQQQLTALDTGHILWQGTVLPGVPMQWEVWSEGKGQRPSSSDSAPGWNTTLRLQLPALGMVEARLQWPGASVGLSLTVQAPTPAVGQVLARSSAELRQALQDAGIPVAQLRVSQQTA